MWQVIILAYIAVVVAIGAKAKATTLEEFILGDVLDAKAMIATIVSTFYGASSVLGGVSLTYRMGLGVIWFMVPFYLGSVVVVLLLKKIRNSETYTLPDFLGGFYGREFAMASSILLAIMCLIPEEIIAGGKILSTFAPVPLEVGMVIVTLVLVVPVAIGGMKADVMTDVVQFILMCLTLVVIVPFVLGPQPTVGVPEGHLNLFSGMSSQEMAVFFVLLFFLPITSAPLYQRLFVSESEGCARKSLLYSIGIWMAIDLIVVLCGFSARRMFPDLEDPDMALIMLGGTLPPVAKVVFFVGLLAVIVSTVNSFLQSGASSLAYDAFRYVKPTAGKGRLLTISRLFVVMLGLLSLALALWFRAIVPALMFTLSMWIVGTLIPTLAALMGKRLKKKVALCSLLGGTLSSLVWKVWQPCDIDALFVGLGGSLLVTLVAQFVRARSH